MEKEWCKCLGSIKNYDIATKASLVEEYLELSKAVKISKADFAYQKGVSDSTFNDSVIKY